MSIHIAGDVVTAYGTMIYEPFSNTKVSWPVTFQFGACCYDGESRDLIRFKDNKMIIRFCSVEFVAEWNWR